MPGQWRSGRLRPDAARSINPGRHRHRRPAPPGRGTALSNERRHRHHDPQRRVCVHPLRGPRPVGAAADGRAHAARPRTQEGQRRAVYPRGPLRLSVAGREGCFCAEGAPDGGTNAAAPFQRLELRLHRGGTRSARHQGSMPAEVELVVSTGSVAKYDAGDRGRKVKVPPSSR